MICPLNALMDQQVNLLLHDFGGKWLISTHVGWTTPQSWSNGTKSFTQRWIQECLWSEVSFWYAIDTCILRAAHECCNLPGQPPQGRVHANVLLHQPVIRYVWNNKLRIQRRSSSLLTAISEVTHCPKDNVPLVNIFVNKFVYCPLMYFKNYAIPVTTSTLLHLRREVDTVDGLDLLLFYSRQFFKPVDTKILKHKSHIRERLVQDGTMDHYLQLHNKNVCWQGFRYS